MLRRRAAPSSNGLSAEVERIAALTAEFRETLVGVREGRDGLRELHRAAERSFSDRSAAYAEWQERSQRMLETLGAERLDLGEKITGLDRSVAEIRRNADRRADEQGRVLEELQERTHSAIERIQAAVEQWSVSTQQHETRLETLERWSQDSHQALSGLVAHRAHVIERLSAADATLASVHSELSSRIARQRNLLILAFLAIGVLGVTLAWIGGR